MQPDQSEPSDFQGCHHARFWGGGCAGGTAGAGGARMRGRRAGFRALARLPLVAFPLAALALSPADVRASHVSGAEPGTLQPGVAAPDTTEAAATERGIADPRLELRVAGAWMEAPLVDGMRLVCRPEESLVRSPELPRCWARRFGFSPPITVHPAPATRLVPGRHLWQQRMAFRVGAGWDRLELRDTRSPAQPARQHPLSGAADEVVEIPSVLLGRGAAWTACLERIDEGEVHERACFGFGTMPADWGQPMDARIVTWPDAPLREVAAPTDPPRGLSAFHPAEGWVPAQNSATTYWDGTGASVADGAGLRGDPNLPALRMEPEGPEGLVRLRVPRGWTELSLSRDHEDAVEVLGLTAPDPEGFVALHDRWSLDPDHGHEITLRVPVFAGDTWQICTREGDASRATSSCHVLRFIAPGPAPAAPGR